MPVRVRDGEQVGAARLARRADLLTGGDAELGCEPSVAAEAGAVVGSHFRVRFHTEGIPGLSAA